MTAPKAKRTITPELVDMFLEYYGRGPTPSWGEAFHVQLGNGNYKIPYWDNGERTDEEQALGAIFNELSSSQRSKLGKKVERQYYLTSVEISQVDYLRNDGSGYYLTRYGRVQTLVKQWATESQKEWDALSPEEQNALKIPDAMELIKGVKS